ncbi:hypothetical protein ABFS83_03G001800 [Erythranthe nasuta]
MPPVPPLASSSSTLRSSTSTDHLVLNMSPTTPSLNQFPEVVHVKKTTTFSDSKSNACLVSDGNTTLVSKSSAELVNEIATLEIQILHLERYLLSLYRTNFHHNLPKLQNNHHIEQINATPQEATSDQPSHKMKLLGMSIKDSKDYQDRSSPTSSLAGPNDSVQLSIPNSSSSSRRKEKQSRSLADHLGNCCIDDARICPDRLSGDIIRCICSIYCKLVNPTLTFKGCSGSSTSSFCSSSTFSPRNLSGSWSPQCNKEVTEIYDTEGVKQEKGPYALMVEILKICLDDESYSYAAMMLQKFRSLVKCLEIVDPTKMRREEKLAFWINIHNALVMHAYLAYGTQHYLKSTSVLKAAYNVGGHRVNAYDIQSSILRIRSHYPAPWLQTLLSPGKKYNKSVNATHAYAIEYPEPLVHFALCSGAYSDPAIRVYTSNNVFNDLRIAKEEFVQATVYIHKEKRIYLPKILSYYAKDMSMGMAVLLEVVSRCLSGIQQKAVVKTCAKGRPEKYVYWLEQSSSFRYLIHKEIAETTWGS